jgi:hypothetical protein
MGTSPKATKDQQTTDEQNLIAGLEKHATTLPSLMFAGVAVPTTTIITTLQSRIDARMNTATNRATWQAVVQAETATIAQSKAMVSGTRQALKVMFAGQIEMLADFGLKPPKPRTPLTTEEKAAAKAKADATRAARHTMGPKQKAKITGTTVAPATPPAQEPVTATPVGVAAAAQGAAQPKA